MADQETAEQHAAIKHIGDIIAKGESYGGDYGAYNTGKGGRAGRKDLSSTSIRDIANKNGDVRAAGKYQLTAITAQDAMGRGKLSGETKLTAANQEMIFEKFLLGPAKTPNTYKYIRSGSVTMDAAVHDISAEWRSIETPNGTARAKGMNPLISDGRYAYDEQAVRVDSGSEIAAAVEAARVAFGAKGSASQLTAPGPKHAKGVGNQQRSGATKPKAQKQAPTEQKQPTDQKETKKDADGYRGYQLTASVGKGGENQHDDVLAVQTRLDFFGIHTNADGKYGASTQKAIDAFQQPFGIRDGLIEVGKKSAKELFSGQVTAEAKITGVADQTQKQPTQKQQSTTTTAKKESQSNVVRKNGGYQIGKYWSSVAPGNSPALYTGGFESRSNIGGLPIKPGVQLTPQIIQGLTKLAPLLAGVNAHVTSGFRSDEHQGDVIVQYGGNGGGDLHKALLDARAKGTIIAWAGSSPHRSGHAIDFGGDINKIRAIVDQHAAQIGATRKTLLEKGNHCAHVEVA